jgi:hypothetical protein
MGAVIVLSVVVVSRISRATTAALRVARDAWQAMRGAISRASVRLVDESSRRCIGKADANSFPVRLEREFHNAARTLRPWRTLVKSALEVTLTVAKREATGTPSLHRNKI